MTETCTKRKKLTTSDHVDHEILQRCRSYRGRTVPQPDGNPVRRMSSNDGVVNRRRAATGVVCPAVVSGTNDITPAAGTVNSTKLRNMINRDVSAVNMSRRNMPPKRVRRKRSTSKSVTPASIPANGSEKRATNQKAGLPKGSDQVAVQQNGRHLSVPTKNCKQRHNFRRKKRTKAMAPAMPSGEEEDWEKESEEVTLSGGDTADGEQMSFGIQPNGPEDVLSFALQKLDLCQKFPTRFPVSVGYSPAWHHRCPVQCTRSSIPTEPDQFVDAEE